MLDSKVDKLTASLPHASFTLLTLVSFAFEKKTNLINLHVWVVIYVSNDLFRKWCAHIVLAVVGRLGLCNECHYNVHKMFLRVEEEARTCSKLGTGRLLSRKGSEKWSKLSENTDKVAKLAKFKWTEVGFFFFLNWFESKWCQANKLWLYTFLSLRGKQISNSGNCKLNTLPTHQHFIITV